MSVIQMSQETKLALFLFLGLVLAMLLGFSRSPKASVSTGARALNTRANKQTSAVTSRSSQRENYTPNDSY